MALIDKEIIRKEIERLEGENNCGTSDFIESKRIAYKQVKEALETLIPELRESEDERIRKAIESIIRVYGKTQGEWIAGYDMDTLVVYLRNAFASLEKQKESLHISETCKENADSFTDEDERIRQFLIEILSSGVWRTEWPFSPVDCVAYLEKQKEPSLREFIDDFPYDEQKEQKPNYCHHEVDEIGWTEEYRKAYYDGWNNCNMQHSQLKAEQKPAEWSEEDKEMLDAMIDIVSNSLYEPLCPREEMLVWLKSLRPSWKPSEEQMEALSEAMARLCGSDIDSIKYAELCDLEINLKKLM